jgi:thiosulfate dehydrogenase
MLSGIIFYDKKKQYRQIYLFRQYLQMDQQENKLQLKKIAKLAKGIVYLTTVTLLLMVAGMVSILVPKGEKPNKAASTAQAVSAVNTVAQKNKTADLWKAPDTSTIPKTAEGKQIAYGRALIVHTADYLGPKGKVMTTSNGMNCQNCHVDGGTRILGLNYSAVASTYPQFKARSNKITSIADRINGCFERSLNGKKLDTNATEMKAMIAYMKWLGQGVPKGVKPAKNALEKLAYLDRPADPLKGRLVYDKLCQSCHGDQGQGKMDEINIAYTFPPLWGDHSYNDGAGLYRLSNLAGFVKNNMPFGTTSDHPLLSDEEAWDLAAFVNTQPRPHKDQSKDWKDIAKKPIDFPFGPYADQFTEKQHKFGPFKPIKNSI